MIIYCIIHTESNIRNRDTYKLLQEAAKSRGVEFIPIEADNFDYAHGLDALDTSSVVYRLAGGARSAILELMMVQKGIKGLYDGPQALLARQFPWGSALCIQQAGLPIIPSIYNVSKNEDARLKQYVDELGGFPVILKASGGSHGEGVMKFDSLTSLRSALAYISTDASSDLILRQFIDSARHLRLVVLGDRVVDAIEYDVQPDDFRTNAVTVPTVVARNDIDDSIKQLAVGAVSAQGLEFAGVDILIGKDSKPYVAEVNFPCNFARNQLNTGTNIAEQMVDYLVYKNGGTVMTDLSVIGRAEMADIIDLKIKKVPVKVDTGADASSIWAHVVERRDHDNLHVVFFGRGSEFYTGVEHVFPPDTYLVTRVANSFGHREIRYKVKLSIRIKGRLIKSSFTLSDRSKKLYPILIGRSLLTKKFVVDVSKGSPLRKLEKARAANLAKEMKIIQGKATE